MRILFVAGFGPIVRDKTASWALYRDALGIAFEADGDYLHTGALDGCRHFALWPIEDAAESCFGTRTWPADVTAPQGWIEFDVEDEDVAVRELQDRGYRLLVAGRQEPWGQTVTRLIGPEGLLVGVTITPGLRE